MTSIQEHRPTGIIHDKEAHELRITWADGVSSYPLNALREACPCASCRGGHEFMGAEYDPDLLLLAPSKSYEAVRLEIAGNYALVVTWDDGHNAGFYTWDYLRRISPPQPES
jgi:DUF971 family protein